MRTHYLLPLLLSASLLAQSPSPQRDPALPTYEVSTIRASSDEANDRRVSTRPNSVEIRNMPLLGLLKSAFNVPEANILNMPEWAKHANVDIDAKTLETDLAKLRALTFPQRRQMMLALFEDRLGLKWHNETRTLPSYELLLANGGPKLTPTKSTGQNNSFSINSTRFRLTNNLASDLAVVLSDKLGKPVVDKTGLTGRYDITLEWSDDETPITNAEAPPPLPTALQEKLGLKLKSANDPIQVIVIDQLNQPSAN